MAPESKKTPAPAVPTPREAARDEGDFADEAGPKSSEFDTKKDARDITSGEFDKLP